jgi:hypothetical protein
MVRRQPPLAAAENICAMQQKPIAEKAEVLI